MQRTNGGWHQLSVVAGLGSRYKFLVASREGGTMSVPDPASRSNPDGVHGASEVIDPHHYLWQAADWRGRPFTDAVLYELHVGTFTAEGSFAAAAQRLPELAALGVTAVQPMPLAAFPGQRNWGYDGVLQFAPCACYGTPDEPASHPAVWSRRGSAQRCRYWLDLPAVKPRRAARAALRTPSQTHPQSSQPRRSRVSP
jgi:1,4-alpha-glucan branching enzyme